MGSRSALFAPLARVGLIVVDEEQEPTYKQESSPRYHAVDAALELGRLTGAAVVLGSATPRVVTYAAAKAGALTLLTLPDRVMDLPLPKTTIVDLRLELKANNRSTLSGVLRTALKKTVARGEQAILYLNRRGFATVVLCRDCGYVVPCPACEIPFALHADGRLVCHRCGREAPQAPAVCPQCGSRRIRHLGSADGPPGESPVFRQKNVREVFRPARDRHRAAGPCAWNRPRNPSRSANRHYQ